MRSQRHTRRQYFNCSRQAIFILKSVGAFCHNDFVAAAFSPRHSTLSQKLIPNMTIHNCIQNSSTPIPSPVLPLASTSSTSGELWTPPFYLDKVRAVLGDIDLDPFSCADANLTVRASRYFVKG